MSYTLPEEPNPFEPPRAGIGGSLADFGVGDTDAEMIRRANLSHEASVKSIGWLYLFTSLLGGLLTIGLFLAAFAGDATAIRNLPQGFTPENFRILMIVGGVLALLFTGLFGALGYGLRKLQVWARWTLVTLLVLNFLYTIYQIIWAGLIFGAPGLVGGLIGGTIGSIIPLYFFYLVASARAGVVFSPDYKMIIAKTPHIKYKTSIILKIALVILLLILGLAIVGGIMSAIQQRG